MKRTLFILLASLAFRFSASSQADLQEKWHMFSRNRIVRLTITKDKMLSDQLNWNLGAWDPEQVPDTSLIVKRIPAHGNQYFLLTLPHDSTNAIHLNTFIVITPSKEITLVVNSPDNTFPDIIHAQQYIDSDTSRKYGLPLFSEEAIHSLQQLKSIDAMAPSDFKRYATKIIANRLRLDSLSKLSGPSNGLLYYGYSMLRTALGEVGFNPLVTNSQMEDLYRRFQNAPETKEVYKQIFH